MLTSVQGYYDGRQIVLSEVPDVTAKTKVIVTFLPNEVEISQIQSERPLGFMKGKIKISDNFDDDIDDLKDYM
jgi:hypothetical protein